MLRMTYRQKRYLKRTFKVLAISVAALAALLILFLQYVGRYVIYTADGVTIDYSRSAQKLEVSAPPSSEPKDPIDAEIVYEAFSPEIADSAPIKGVYLTVSDLQNLDALSSRIDALQPGDPVMLELKSPRGYFYYDTSITGAETADVDIDAITQLISDLRQRDCNLIALVPAFSDYSFALANLSCGLPMSNGALWVDENNCYWLDPASETVTNYLRQIARELSSMGFSEVVFEDFYFPSSQNIFYNSDLSRAEVVARAARELSDFFAGSNLTISFVAETEDFSVEDLTGRLYIKDVDAAQLEQYMQAYSSLNPYTQLVFFTSSKDPRFDPYSTMSPLS